MKEIEYEKLADSVNYIYFRRTNDTSKCDKTDTTTDVCGGTQSIIGPHYHKAVEIKLIIKGELIFGLDGEWFEMKAGDICFADSYKVHFYKGVIKNVCYDFVVDCSYLEGILSESQTLTSAIYNKELYDELLGIFDNAYDKWDSMDQNQKRGFVIKVFGTMIQHIGIQSKNSDDKKKHRLAQQIIEYIYKHYKEEITIKSLSNVFGYAEGYFSRLFNQVTGVSIREYINCYRIEMADKLKIEDPSRSLLSISEEVGYTSWVTFYRAYKKYSKLRDK